ncbi:hypothetical protein [Cupriavidus campinensis]|uniref:ImmA/IrrE family metallo-endopeptidase n=1 Tax=Cupriavidus campinensis TaxID=151783 RepID=A0ABY3ET75_9BURK|nr:hypothetical protein [Cupriavidus campinensis]TSP13938.1 hypothetical protein FGG12_05540 [Cupriavidus campinensis]
MSDAYKGLPKRVRIGAFWFDVEVIPPYEGTGEFGHMNVGSQMIRVSPDQRPENLANTFIHEVIHAIHWANGLLDEKSDEEDYTIAAANGLCAFVQDNPEAMAWFVKHATVKA